MLEDIKIIKNHMEKIKISKSSNKLIKFTNKSNGSSKLSKLDYYSFKSIYELNEETYDLYKDKIIPSIDIQSRANITLQFKLNGSFIKNILFEHNNNKWLYDSKVFYDGILININMYINDTLRIIPSFTTNCGKINLWDFQKITNTDEITNNIYWDKIFIINLLRRPDRKVQMIEKLKILGIHESKYEFIEAIDGSNKSIYDEFIELKDNNKTKIVSSGHYACLLSHIYTIKKAQNLGLNQIMILEDDVIFSDNFIDIINKIIIPEYDMVYLGGIIDQVKFFTNNWGLNKTIMGAYAYVLNKKIYQDVIRELEEKIYCVDVCFIEKIQSNYKVFILDDLIKTNIDTTDTSFKSNTMVKMLEKTYIKVKTIC